MDIEVCVEKTETALIANRYGATRIELCSSLDLGGLTPSVGLIKSCIEKYDLQVFVMIRPKPGGFVYDYHDIDIMKKDIKAAAHSGATGVVFGCLTADFNIDIGQNKELLELAKSFGLGVTFHRAFDFTKNVPLAFEQIIDLGFDRILTSGGEKTAIEGFEQINQLIRKNKNRIEIMAGSGINSHNCRRFTDIGIDAIHFTARKTIMDKNSLNMGKEYIPDEEKIKKIIKLSSHTV